MDPFSPIEMCIKRMLNRMLPAGIVATLFVTVYAKDLCAQTENSELTTMCTVAKQPDSFNGRLITVRARVMADGEHGSLIYDDSCAHSGLELFVASGAKGEDELDAALNWCHRGTRGKLIYGTFTGVFHFRPPYIGDSARPQIIVSLVSDLVLSSAKTASASFPTPCPEAPPLDSLVHRPIRTVQTD